MRTLVAYATGSGCTAQIAEWIAAELIMRGHSAEAVDVKGGPDPSSYDAVILGSGVRAGQWHGPARQWITQHAEALRARPVAVFSVCLNVVSNPNKPDEPIIWDEINGYAEKACAPASLTPVASQAFAGWWEPKRFGFAERMIMKMMKTPVGDYRDEAAVRAWAGQVAALLRVEPQFQWRTMSSWTPLHSARRACQASTSSARNR